MENRAVVRLDIKAVDDDKRQIEGWATTPLPDRQNDIVEPLGAKFELPLPLLLDHEHKSVVGEVDRVEVTQQGIKFWAHIKRIAEPGEVKDLCDTAWTLVKNNMRRAVSIGFRALDHEPLAGGGQRFKQWEWLELSLVGIPAQGDAKITAAKAAGLTVKRTVKYVGNLNRPYGLTDAERTEIFELKALFRRNGWELQP